MNIKIITVGKIKEKYLRMAIDEYSKRLGAYCRLSVIEVKDEKIEERFSDAEKARAVALEGERIARHLKDNDGLQGKSSLTFIIGGSLGLAPEIEARAHWDLSFSKMTFPHQLFRVMLLEQIYRAFKIIRNETYHK